jgi:hypothetical protein
MLDHLRKPKNKPTASTRDVPNPKDSDIYLVSHPKSGSTWVRYLLAYALWPEVESPEMTELGSYVPSYSDKLQLLDPSSLCNKSDHRIIKEHCFISGNCSKERKVGDLYLPRWPGCNRFLLAFL